MHEYAYRCERCGERFSLRYARYADYDAAEKRCPACENGDLTRILTVEGGRKQHAGGGRDYAALSAREMLSVLETGDAREAKRLYEAVERGVKERGGAKGRNTAHTLRSSGAAGRRARG
ncbi:MAG: hypothetical protein OXF83_02990 [Anaerolineaceae bacterium]|nr:hypothetical protein [Anaerolineaceae bacterium]